MKKVGQLEQELNKVKSECENYKYQNEALKAELATLKVNLQEIYQNPYSLLSIIGSKSTERTI